MYRAKTSNNNVESQITSLRSRVNELEETLQAIRRGSVDALVINGPGGDQVFTLQGAEHPYRVLVEAMNEGAATLNADGVVLYANTRFAEIFGVGLEKTIGSELADHIPAPEDKKLRDLVAQAMRDTTRGEISLISREGRKMLIRLSLSPVKESNLQTICIVATELTELVEANEALRANEEALRQLSGRLLQLQDDERRRIARDLHDVTGQKLAFQAMTISHLLKSDANLDDPEIRRNLEECLSLTHQASGEIRTLSYLLHPPLLDELGLESAVRWYIEGFQNRTKIQVRVDISSDFPRLPADSEVALFRIIQESLTNVHRYSQSATARVSVHYDGAQVMLQVEDFGKGMSKGIKKSSDNPGNVFGVGIQGMQERMRQLSGRLEIFSPPKGGTLITAVLPFTAAQKTESSPEVDDTPAVKVLQEATLPNELDVKRRILIADDHEVLRRGVRTMLEAEVCWEVCGEAIDGQDALEKTLTLKPDLLILDINMPALNGLAALRRVLQSRPQTKVLIFTVHDSDQMAQESLGAGAHGYVSKARAGQDLVHAVKTVLSGGNFYAGRTAKAAS